MGFVIKGEFLERYNADGDTEKTLSIPSGVKRIGTRAFYECPAEEVYLPDSVININPQAFKRNKSEYGITLHCKPGSYAREAAERMGIDYAD